MTKIWKYKWWIAGFLVFLYPFYFQLISKITGLNLGELYTFGLPLNEFMTVWIALGGIIGVVFNITLMQKRINKTDDQIQIQQKQLRDNRFSSGVELLGNSNESARIGGAYNLYFLANEYPDEYLNPVCEILCAHIRTITSDKDYQEKYKEKPSNEIHTILKHLLFRKNKSDKLIFDGCKKNLTEVFLCGIDFRNNTLSNVYFWNATLNNVYFDNAILNNIDFQFAELNRVYFISAKLNNASFSFISELSDARFDNAELDNVDFDGTVLSVVSFGGAKLNGVRFVSATLNGVHFSKIIESNNVNFGAARLRKVFFVGAEISDVCFGGAELSDVCFSFARLSRYDFSSTSLEDYSIEEITQKGRSLELTKSEKESKDE